MKKVKYKIYERAQIKNQRGVNMGKTIRAKFSKGVIT
jgi:hypothetical protein